MQYKGRGLAHKVVYVSRNNYTDANPIFTGGAARHCDAMRASFISLSCRDQALVSFSGLTFTRSGRNGADRQTHTHTQDIVTLAAHALRGLIYRISHSTVVLCDI